MRMKLVVALLLGTALLAGCGGSGSSVSMDAAQATIDSTVAQAAAATAAATAGQTIEQAATDAPTPDAPTPEAPAPPPAPEDPPVESPPQVDPSAAEEQPAPAPPSSVGEIIAYNLPPALLNTETGLYVSPNRGDLVAPVIIPVGSTIYIMGRNATSSHLRAVWNTAVGWVPVSFTSYGGDREGLGKLPAFEQEPPSCAEPITTQFNLGSTWTADRRMRAAIVVDLFRSRFGDFPQSYLLLTVNGAAVETSRRPIVERGQFSLKDIVFSLPGYLQAGDTLGYQLETSSAEDLAFMATIFNVPDGCVWDLD